MKKKLAIVAILTVVLSGAVVFGQNLPDKAEAVTQDQCQYPNRPLVNGNCDNSDPAVPECIKAENEAECAKNYTAPKPVESAPVASPATEVQTPRNTCSK